jgi:hypothetical protein
MKRQSPKKGIESRGKKTARAKEPSSRKSSKVQKKAKDKEGCQSCFKPLAENDRALFVEEEIGRIFCSETCIANYFTPEIEKLEKEYFARKTPNDLSADERESLAHLRWLTLQEPDEVWREKTLSGDYRFTLISEFKPETKKIWCICICLFLRGEPSFLYLAFPTKNAALTNFYRRGERVEMVRQEASPSETMDAEFHHTSEDGPQEAPQERFIDGLADDWTEDETIRAQLTRDRKADDIPIEEFSLYQSCLEETLESPDEVWSNKIKEHKHLRLYHFMKHYPEEASGVWYIVIARETEDDEELELLDAFPTRDSSLVEQFRRGQQEVGTLDSHPVTRMVH